MRLATFPFRVVWGVGSYVLSFASAATQEQSPEAAASALQGLIELKYGNSHPQFYKGGYMQALNKAKAEFKFTLIYLHSDRHQSTAKFCKDVFCQDSFADFVNDNFVFWAADIKTSAGFTMANLLGAEGYPYLAVLCHYGPSTPVLPQLKVPKLSGVVLAEELFGATLESVIGALTSAMEKFGPILVAYRAETQYRDADRRIREEQDQAYQDSLAADREKQRKKREEEEALRREEEERQEAIRQEEERIRQEIELAEKKQQELENRLKSLPPEPNAGEQNTTTIVIRLTDGSKFQRRFYATDTIEFVYQVVAAKETNATKYLLATHYPRARLPLSTKTLREAQLVPQGVLFVEELFE